MRGDSRQPRPDGHYVELPLDEGSASLPIYMSPDEYGAAEIPAACQPPVPGADATGNEIEGLLEGCEDAANMLAAMTAVKVGLACILEQLHNDDAQYRGAR